MITGEIDIIPPGADPQTWLNPKYLNLRPPAVTEFKRGLDFNPDINDGITSVDDVRDLLAEGGYLHSAELDLSIRDGTIDPEKLSRPVTERIAARDEVLLPGLSTFKYRYATVNGATDAIDQLMISMMSGGTKKKVGMIGGDYIGYYGAAVTKGIEVVPAESLETIGEPDDDILWFVSNPSAINGNLYSQEVWQNFLDAGHKVVVDAAYIDLTPEGFAVNVDSENVVAVITSPSKPYGFVHDKYPAVVYMRERHSGLEFQANFCNVPRLLTMLEIELQEQFGPHKIASSHRSTQLDICKGLGEIAGGIVLPSDATLMAHAKGELNPVFEVYKEVNKHKRTDEYTFRLTKAFRHAQKLKLEEMRT